MNTKNNIKVFQNEIIIEELIKWDNFIAVCPNGTIFQSSHYYRLFLETSNYEPIVIFSYKTKQISGCLLAIIHKVSSGLLGYLSARSIIIGGPLANDDETINDLLNEYDLLIKARAIYSEIRNIFDINDYRSLFEHKRYFREDHLDIIFDLKKEESELWAEMHKNRKKEIKKAYTKDIEITELKLRNDSKVFNEVYTMLALLYKRIGLPLPAITFFKNAVDLFEEKGILLTLAIKTENKIIGFRMELVFKGLVFDWYAASIQEYLSYRPNDILPWEVLKWGCKNKMSNFDFGGAGKPNKKYGVRDYKLKFGGELVNYGRFTKIHKPFLFSIGKVGLYLYKSLLNVKKFNTKVKL